MNTQSTNITIDDKGLDILNKHRLERIGELTNKELIKRIRQQIGLELHIELTKAVLDRPRSDTAYGVNIGLEKAAIVASKICQLGES